MRSTFYFDHNDEEWIVGPNLIQKRANHAVGIIIDEVTMEEFLVVTGGDDIGFLSYPSISQHVSTEILKDNEWNSGDM